MVVPDVEVVPDGVLPDPALVDVPVLGAVLPLPLLLPVVLPLVLPPLVLPLLLPLVLSPLVLPPLVPPLLLSSPIVLPLLLPALFTLIASPTLIGTVVVEPPVFGHVHWHVTPFIKGLPLVAGVPDLGLLSAVVTALPEPLLPDVEALELLEPTVLLPVVLDVLLAGALVGTADAEPLSVLVPAVDAHKVHQCLKVFDNVSSIWSN